MPANQSSRAHRQSTRILTVVTVGPHVLRTTRGNLYLPGTTQAGEAIIFWGSAGDRWNIDKVRASGPLTVRCLCREAVSRQGTRQIWVPQISPLEVLEGAVEPAEPKTSWECPPLDETVDEENGEWDEPKDI